MRAFTIALAALLGVAAMPAAAADCYAFIDNTSGHPDISLRINKFGVEWDVGRVASQRLQSGWLVIYPYGGGEAIDLGGCSATDVAAIRDKVQEYIGKFHEDLLTY